MRGALLVDMQQPHLFAVRVALSLCILSACLIKPGIGIHLKIKTKQKQTKAKKKQNNNPQNKTQQRLLKLQICFTI